MKYANENNTTITFVPEFEELSPRDVFDNEDDIQAIYAAGIGTCGVIPEWFCAHVHIEYETEGESFEADNYLGTCSYNSFKEFTTQEDGYYKDMISVCLAEINRDINSLIITNLKSKLKNRLSDKLTAKIVNKIKRLQTV